MNTQSLLPDSPDALQPQAVAPPVAPPKGGDDTLERILPQLKELAQKVGGFGKLADIARELERQE